MSPMLSIKQVFQNIIYGNDLLATIVFPFDHFYIYIYFIIFFSLIIKEIITQLTK